METTRKNQQDHQLSDKVYIIETPENGKERSDWR